MPVNWEGIKKFLNWQGTIEELKQLELPEYVPEEKSVIKGTGFSGGISTVDISAEARRRSAVEIAAGPRPFPELERPDNDLAIRGVSMEPLKPDQGPYRFRVQMGDLVRLPNGDTGTVYMLESEFLDNEVEIKIISIWPTKKRRWFGLRAAIPLRFVNDDINELELIATQAEWETVEY